MLPGHLSRTSWRLGTSLPMTDSSGVLRAVLRIWGLPPAAFCRLKQFSSPGNLLQQDKQQFEVHAVVLIIVEKNCKCI